MKYLLLLALIFSSPALAGGNFMPHEQVVQAMAHNKVGKAPQRGKNGPHPIYNKKSEIFGKKKHKKHHHKKDYSKGGK